MFCLWMFCSIMYYLNSLVSKFFQDSCLALVQMWVFIWKSILVIVWCIIFKSTDFFHFINFINHIIKWRVWKKFTMCIHWVFIHSEQNQKHFGYWKTATPALPKPLMWLCLGVLSVPRRDLHTEEQQKMKWD